LFIVYVVILLYIASQEMYVKETQAPLNCSLFFILLPFAKIIKFFLHYCTHSSPYWRKKTELL